MYLNLDEQVLGYLLKRYQNLLSNGNANINALIWAGFSHLHYFKQGGTWTGVEMNSNCMKSMNCQDLVDCRG